MPSGVQSVLANGSTLGKQAVPLQKLCSIIQKWVKRALLHEVDDGHKWDAEFKDLRLGDVIKEQALPEVVVQYRPKFYQCKVWANDPELSAFVADAAKRQTLLEVQDSFHTLIWIPAVTELKEKGPLEGGFFHTAMNQAVHLFTHPLTASAGRQTLQNVLKVEMALNKGSRYVVYENSFALMQAATKFALEYDRVRTHWARELRVQHFKIVTGAQYALLRRQGDVMSDEDFNDDEQFQEVWSALLHTYLAGLHLPKVRRVVVDVPKGWALVTDNLVFQCALKCSHRHSVYRLRFFMQEIGDETDVDVLKAPFDVRCDKRLFPILGLLGHTWDTR